MADLVNISMCKTTKSRSENGTNIVNTPVVDTPAVDSTTDGETKRCYLVAYRENGSYGRCAITTTDPVTIDKITQWEAELETELAAESTNPKPVVIIVNISEIDVL